MFTQEPVAQRIISRRVFFLSAASIAGGLYYLMSGRQEPVEAGTPVPAGPPKMVSIVNFSDSGKKLGVVEVEKVVKTDAEWKKQLGPTAFEITRHADTESPFTGKYWNLHDKGIYRCICCDTALFSSDTKFESGTGWPSFWEPLAKENVTNSSDSSFGMDRVANACTRCDAHLGHLFDDGPKPTGLRYCMNSGALRFVKLATAD